MRIAVTGAHGVGKTTLIEDVVAARPSFEAVPEPWQLAPGDSMAFVDGLVADDLEEQLSQSCDLILGTPRDADLVFDRCPLDFLAYLDVAGAEGGSGWTPHGRLVARIDDALRSLDLVAFVPVTHPDEIAARIEQPRLRRRVDARLRAMLRDDDLDLRGMGLRVVVVSGTRERRLARLLTELPPTP